jgi:hypothetical protein
VQTLKPTQTYQILSLLCGPKCKVFWVELLYIDELHHYQDLDVFLVVSWTYKMSFFQKKKKECLHVGWATFVVSDGRAAYHSQVWMPSLEYYSVDQLRQQNDNLA